MDFSKGNLPDSQIELAVTTERPQLNGVQLHGEMFYAANGYVLAAAPLSPTVGDDNERRVWFPSYVWGRMRADNNWTGEVNGRVAVIRESSTNMIHTLDNTHVDLPDVKGLLDRALEHQIYLATVRADDLHAIVGPYLPKGRKKNDPLSTTFVLNDDRTFSLFINDMNGTRLTLTPGSNVLWQDSLSPYTQPGMVVVADYRWLALAANALAWNWKNGNKKNSYVTYELYVNQHSHEQPFMLKYEGASALIMPMYSHIDRGHFPEN